MKPAFASTDCARVSLPALRYISATAAKSCWSLPPSKVEGSLKENPSPSKVSQLVGAAPLPAPAQEAINKLRTSIPKTLNWFFIDTPILFIDWKLSLSPIYKSRVNGALLL